MQQLAEVLAKTEALQAARGCLSSEQKTTLRDNDPLAELIKRFDGYYNRISGLPVKNITVANKSECPFTASGLCTQCASGTLEATCKPGDTVRMVYDVSKCYGEYLYGEHVKKSGLCAGQMGHTFENARIDDYNRDVYRSLRKWDYKSGRGIYIVSKPYEKGGDDCGNPGGNGTGKSYGLEALAHKLCRQGVSCLFATTTRFFSELKATYGEYAKENEARIIEKYIHVPVLLWDDMGKENINRNSEWAPSTLYHVINERIARKKPIAISSNFEVDDLAYRLGADNQGAAIFSRLGGNCDIYCLGGPDRRLEM